MGTGNETEDCHTNNIIVRFNIVIKFYLFLFALYSAAEAVNKDKPSEGEKERGEKEVPRPADLPDPKANQL